MKNVVKSHDKKIIKDFFNKLGDILIENSNLVTFSANKMNDKGEVFIANEDNFKSFLENIHNLMNSLSSKDKKIIENKCFKVEEEGGKFMLMLLYDDFTNKRKNIFPKLCFFFGKPQMKDGKEILDVMPRIISICIPLDIPYIYKTNDEMDEILNYFSSSQENKREFVELVSKKIFITPNKNINSKLIV